MRLLDRVRGSLTGKLLAGELAVIAAGSVTLATVAFLLGPPIFRRHVREALGYVPPDVIEHLNDAFSEALWLAIAIAITAAAAVAALIGWLVSARVVAPVRALAEAAERVAGGEREVRVPVGGSDELATLGAAFNRMASTLASVETQRRRLLADIAHELRTPLATLDAHLEGLADGVVSPDTETWTLLRGETSRLARLADDIGTVSLAEERGLDLRFERRAADSLLWEAAAVQQPSYVQTGVELRVAADADSSELLVDADRVGMVLGNLLRNALRHTPAGGRVTLGARRDGEDVVLTVSDTGEGLPASELDQVFERFHRLDPARTRERGGSGLGLAISRAIVEAHGGRIWAESDGPGTGARFCFRLRALPRL
jgi:two-component system, OmpR family, sensor histidine kinase BaeS